MPISKNMNTKNKNARQCAANSYAPQHSQRMFLLALVQSENVLTSNILEKYTDLPIKQVKTSNDPRSIFVYIVKRIKEYGTKNVILYLNDEDLFKFVNYLEEKLKNFKKYRSLFKEVTMASTLSTADNVRSQVASTKHAKHFFQFLQSSLSVVLSTFEDGQNGLILPSEAPVKKSILVIVSNKQTSYYNQAFNYFNDTIDTKVKKIRVNEKSC
jgi:hypothetical protein